MFEPRVRTAKRWGLPAIGVAAAACVGCCALPLLAAGSLVSGGLAFMRDSCLAPLAILLVVAGAVLLAVWIRRARNKDKCGDGSDCRCVGDSEANLLQPATFRPGP